MAAFTNPVPLPQPPPAAEPLPAPPSKSRKWPILVLLLLAVGAGAVAVLRLRDSRAAQSTIAVVVKTARVTRGTIEQRIRVNGATTARNFVNVSAPRLTTPESGREMVLLNLAASGAWVKKGEIVAEFDPQAAKDHLDDTVAGLKDKDSDVLKKQVQNELDMATLKQTLAQAKANLDKARLDFRISPVRTDIDREILQLAVDEAEQSFREMQTDLPLEQESERADLRVTELSREVERRHVARHQLDLARLTIRASAPGMVVLLSMWRPGGEQVTYAVGDRVTPGTTFGRVVDPTSMQVEGFVNQAESSQFRIGQEASVRLDAYPDTTFPGKVDAIGALAISGGRQQYFLRSIPIRIGIRNPDSRVIPDLSASASVLIHHGENVLVAPAGAIQQQNGRVFVSVKTPTGAEERPVTLGASEGSQVELLSGVSEGDVLLLN
jgi:HlyD family secretion protein